MTARLLVGCPVESLCFGESTFETEWLDACHRDYPHLGPLVRMGDPRASELAAWTTGPIPTDGIREALYGACRGMAVNRGMNAL